jgi:hypothetical protein
MRTPELLGSCCTGPAAGAPLLKTTAGGNLWFTARAGSPAAEADANGIKTALSFVANTPLKFGPTSGLPGAS